MPRYRDYHSLPPEEQWKHPMIIELPFRRTEDTGPDGGPLYLEEPPETMRVYDIMPSILEHEIPVMFVPGWTGTAEGFKRLILAMVKLGWWTFAVTAVHGITSGESFAGIPVAEGRKANAFLLATNREELEKVNVAVHSEGSLFTTIAASAHPDLVENLVLDSPAGLIGEDNWIRLLAGFTHDAYDQLVAGMKDKTQVGMIRETFTYIQEAHRGWKNKKMSAAEVRAILSMQIGRHLIELKKQGHGIVIMHHVDDRLFPIQLMAGSVNKKTGKVKPGIVTSDMVDGFLSFKGDHRGMLRNPETYAAVIDHILTALENRKK